MVSFDKLSLFFLLLFIEHLQRVSSGGTAVVESTRAFNR
jgi:hypothetical protein